MDGHPYGYVFMIWKLIKFTARNCCNITQRKHLAYCTVPEMEILLICCLQQDTIYCTLFIAILCTSTYPNKCGTSKDINISVANQFLSIFQFNFANHINNQKQISNVIFGFKCITLYKNKC